MAFQGPLNTKELSTKAVQYAKIVGIDGLGRPSYIAALTQNADLREQSQKSSPTAINISDRN